MPKYISGRSKTVPQSNLRDDRYRYLSVGESEPNLGDPLVGPSSIGAKPVAAGQQYMVVTVQGQTGERYWIPNQGGIIPGSISVFEENFLVGGASSTTQLNFIGNSVTAEGVAGPPAGVGVTITIVPPGIDNEVLFKDSGDFATDSTFTFDSAENLLAAGDRITVGAGGTVITTTASGFVGIGTTNPTRELHLQGDFRITGDLYDTFNSSGQDGYILTRAIGGGLLWVREESVITGAGGTIGQIQFHNTAGLVDGADNFYYDFNNNRVGIGSTQPTQLLDVLGVSTFSGGVFIDDLSVSGVSTFTGTIDANGNLDVDGQTELDDVNVSGLSTFASNVDMNAGLDVDGQTDLDVLNVSETASFTATTDNTLGNVNTGAVQLDGGAGIAKNLTVGQTIQATNLNITGIGTIETFDFGTGLFDNIKVTGISTLGNVKVEGSTVSTNSGTLTLNSAGNSIQIHSTDKLVVNNTTSSTSTNTGALIVSGGAGIAENLHVGGNIVGTVTTAINLAGGAAGSLPYQSDTGSTTFLADPNQSGYVLTYNNTSDAPEWTNPTSVSGLKGQKGQKGQIGVKGEIGEIGVKGQKGADGSDAAVTLGSNLTDLFDVTSGTLSADDPGADKIFYWDDSASKATHLGISTGLYVDGNNLTSGWIEDTNNPYTCANTTSFTISNLPSGLRSIRVVMTGLDATAGDLVVRPKTINGQYLNYGVGTAGASSSWQDNGSIQDRQDGFVVRRNASGADLHGYMDIFVIDIARFLSGAGYQQYWFSQHTIMSHNITSTGANLRTGSGWGYPPYSSSTSRDIRSIEFLLHNGTSFGSLGNATGNIHLYYSFGTTHGPL